MDKPNCCPKHLMWRVLGAPPLSKHENRCDGLPKNLATNSPLGTSDIATTAAVTAQAGLRAVAVSGGPSETSREKVGSGIAHSAEDILDILCGPNRSQVLSQQNGERLKAA